MPTHEQGIKVLGTPLGHDDFVKDLFALVALRSSKSQLLTQIRPSTTENTPRQTMRGCASVWPPSSAVSAQRQVSECATLPLRLGGLGLTSAMCIRGSSH